MTARDEARAIAGRAVNEADACGALYVELTTETIRALLDDAARLLDEPIPADEREEPDLPNGHAPIDQLSPFLARRIQDANADEGNDEHEALYDGAWQAISGRDEPWGGGAEREKVERVAEFAARFRRQGPITDERVEYVRAALNAADIDYSAREQRADAGGDMEPGDWFTFMARAALEAAEAKR